MLQISGKCVGVESETVNASSGSFVSTTIGVEVGEGLRKRVELVRAGRDFPPADLPRKDDDVTLVVVVGAYTSRNGAGYRLTALERVKSGLRAAAV